MGSAPRIEDVDVPLPSENFKDILIKRVHITLRRERIADCEYFIMVRYAELSLLCCLVLPLLLDDLNRREFIIDTAKKSTM